MRGAGVWAGGGLTPLRVDREAVLRRLGGEYEGWVVEGLLDAFEPAAVAAIHANAKAADKSRGRDGEV